MEVLECIRSRRTIREFAPRPVPADIIRRIMEAGRLAPSAHNRQPWHFVVVQARERLKQLAAISPSGRFVAQAAFAVVVAVDPDNPWHVIDASRAVQQMELAGWSQGVGMCWVGRFEASQVADLIGLPQAWRILSILAFGYPAAPVTGPRRRGARKPMPEVCSWERYGNGDPSAP